MLGGGRAGGPPHGRLGGPTGTAAFTGGAAFAPAAGSWGRAIEVPGLGALNKGTPRSRRVVRLGRQLRGGQKLQPRASVVKPGRVSVGVVSWHGGKYLVSAGRRQPGDHRADQY